MKLDHVAMYVKDLEAARDFFIRFFGAKSNEMYHNPKTGLKTFFLTFEGGSRLEIMTRPEVSQAPQEPFRAGYAHISFSLGGREKVDALTDALRLEGCEVASEPRLTGDGYYESCVVGPEGCRIEISE